MRPPLCENNDLKKGAWSPAEDQMLMVYVTRYGTWNWTEIPKFAGLSRTGKSCRLRWMNYLRPGLRRGNITKEEEENIISLHNLLGNKWSAIAAKFPGRTDNEIKNHWYTDLKKRSKNIPESSIEDMKISKFRAKETNNIVVHNTTIIVSPTLSEGSNQESHNINYSSQSNSTSPIGDDEIQNIESTFSIDSDFENSWTQSSSSENIYYVEDQPAVFVDDPVFNLNSSTEVNESKFEANEMNEEGSAYITTPLYSPFFDCPFASNLVSPNSSNQVDEIENIDAMFSMDHNLESFWTQPFSSQSMYVEYQSAVLVDQIWMGMKEPNYNMEARATL